MRQGRIFREWLEFRRLAAQEPLKRDPAQFAFYGGAAILQRLLADPVADPAADLPDIRREVAEFLRDIKGSARSA